VDWVTVDEIALGIVLVESVLAGVPGHASTSHRATSPICWPGSHGWR
jgi:hypothetical protein